MDADRDAGSKNGKMDKSTLATGTMILLTEKEFLFMQMAMSMMANG